MTNDGKIQDKTGHLVHEVLLYPVFSPSSLYFSLVSQSGVVCRDSPSPTIPRTSNLCITSLEAGFLIQSNGRRATEGLTGASGRHGYGLAWGGLVRNHGKEWITESLWAWWCPSHTPAPEETHQSHDTDVYIPGRCYAVAKGFWVVSSASLCGC